MSLTHSLESVNRLFLDTAPIIYFVEQHPIYYPLTKPIFEYIDTDQLEAVTSPVTLAECLVIPEKMGNSDLRQDFQELVIRGHNTTFFSIDHQTGQFAASIRARHNLSLLDAFQVAVAINANCDAFLTNDKQLLSISDLKIIVLDELAGQSP